MSRIVSCSGFRGNRVCSITVGDGADQVPPTAIGLCAKPGERYEIVLLLCQETRRLFAACYAYVATGLPCELQSGDRESRLCLGVLDDLCVLRGRIDGEICRLRALHTRDPFDLLGCIIDDQLAPLLSSHAASVAA